MIETPPPRSRVGTKRFTEFIFHSAVTLNIYLIIKIVRIVYTLVPFM